MQKIPREDWELWTHYTSDHPDRGEVMLADDILVQCPKCRRKSVLSHDVADDGTVSPSLVCDRDGCDFHDYVQLRGWGDTPNRKKEPSDV